MKRQFLFALASGIAMLAIINGGSQMRAQSRTHASAASSFQKTAPPVAAKTAAKSSVAPAAKITVREIDDAGLEKLLQREPSQDKPLLINFWATWCDPCREEFPDLVKLDEKYRALGLDFVLVSLDDVAEIEQAVPEFLQKMRAGAIPAYLLNVVDPAPAIGLVDKEWHGELPATFLFDRAGRIAYKHTGRIKPAELGAAIEKTLNAGR